MFQENITREIVNGDYTRENALLEILILVSVAFILGWISRWIWDCFFKHKNVFFVFWNKTIDKIKSIVKSSSKDKFVFKKEIKERFENKKTRKENDNLRFIEGVGPKIESLLEREGIDSFKKLSTSNTEEIKNILKKAGDRYAFHNPSTWPEQALLAYNKKWDELEEFQEFLRGGRSI